MTYEEAIAAATGGQRVRRWSMPRGAYVCETPGPYGAFIAMRASPIGNARRYTPTAEEEAATDWEVVS